MCLPAYANFISAPVSALKPFKREPGQIKSYGVTHLSRDLLLRVRIGYKHHSSNAQCRASLGDTQPMWVTISTGNIIDR